jgi:PhnB protein
MEMNPYLNFPGNCEEAFNFYKSVFGGEFPYVGRYKDMPPQPGVTFSKEDLDKIMHISLPLGNGKNMLMGSDVGGHWAPDIKTGNNISICLSPDRRAEVDRIFNALAKGGKITMPLADTFWGDYFGMCTDKFGINWMMSYKDKSHKK